MLEILILYIQATFKNSFPAIQDVHTLAEQIKNGNTAFPSVYCTNDEYQPLEGNENFLYFRQLGAATEDESDEESVSGCDHYVTRTYPMVAVAYIPKNIFNTDNAFVDSKIAGNIANILRVANYGALTASMKADEIHAEVTRISTDRYEVWDQEFKGIDMAARFDHVLCAVEFDLVVSATERCLQNFDCNDAVVSIEGDTINIVVTCGCPPPIAFSVPSANFSIQDDRLIGGTSDGLFVYHAGTEQGTIDNIQSYDSVTGTITFVSDLGGVGAVKILLVL